MCELLEETIEQFMTCRTYGKTSWEIDWKLIYLNSVENLNSFAKEVKRRQFIRKKKLDKVGRPPNMVSVLQSNIEQKKYDFAVICYFWWKYIRLD